MIQVFHILPYLLSWIKHISIRWLKLGTNLTGAQDAQTWFYIFTKCVLRKFLEEISIWIDRLSKANGPIPSVVCIIQFVEALSRTKRWKKAELVLYAWAETQI
jgi:exonuclease V gamma subunit